MAALTLDTLKAVAPKGSRSSITQELVDKINDANQDPDLLGGLSENVLAYSTVLRQGKFAITDYISAVKYVSYKLLNRTNLDAYAMTFPDRYQRLVDMGLDRDGMSPYASAYQKTKLITTIMEQTIVPTHILNAPMHQEALNIALSVAKNGKSEMAKVTACNTILQYTKPPETTKIQLDIGTNESDAILDLKASLADFAAVQLDSIGKGQVSVKQLGALKPKEEEDIIDV